MADEIPEITVANPEEVDTETSGDARKSTSLQSKTKTSGTSLTTAPITRGEVDEGEGEEVEEEGEMEFDFRARTEDDMDRSEWGDDEVEEGEGMYEEYEEGDERRVGEETGKPPSPQVADEGVEGAKKESSATSVKDAGTAPERKAELAPVSEEVEGEEDNASTMSKLVQDMTEEVVDAAARRSRMSKLQDVVDSQEPAHSESDDDSAERKGSVVSISRSLSHHLDTIEKEDRGKHPRMPGRKTKVSPAGQKRPSMTLGPGEEEALTQEQEDMQDYPWEGSCSSSSTSTPSLEGEEEHSSLSVMTVEEKEEEWSREAAVDLYKKLTRDKFVLKRKNIVLMKRVNEFFKLKKWEIYTDESSGPEPQQEARYQVYLKQFEEYTRREKEVRDNVNVKLSEMERMRSQAEDEEQKALEDILSRQREIGQGLISDRTGKPMPNKMLERLILRQVRTLEELKVLRTKYIKIRDAHESKELELKKLEQLGEGLYLKDYEQLRMENQSYCDKIEERDEELTQLRNRATSSIQILAHIREKANATANSIQELYEDLEFTEYEASRNREFVGVLKKQRDDLRAELKELRDSAGLLVHKRLVEDFERSLALSQQLNSEINSFKSQYAEGMVALEKARAGDDWRRSHGSTVARLLNTHRGRQTGLSQWASKSKRASSMGRLSLGPRMRSKKMKMRLMSEARGSTPSIRSVDVAEITKTRPAFFPPIKHSILEYF